MSELASEFEAMVREEHQQMRGVLRELADAFWWRVPEYFPSILRRVAAITGPHFRCEEEVLYPALEKVGGIQPVTELLANHNQLKSSAERLAELAKKEVWSDEEVGVGIELIHGLLQHVNDCDGLVAMVERLPDETVRNILDAHKRFNKASLDLLRWAQEVKKLPIPAAN
ncbi:MAG: hemerythrin domain-containing protein [Acidobacteria bacterium]|nr:hemerythrin domain-containing protein [Acidobacteriota bacterium]